MKRFILICATLLIANCTMAQIITWRTITKVEQQSQSVTSQSRKGFGQYVNLSYGYNKLGNFLGAHYIGGYRFNDMFFLGVGVGVEGSFYAPEVEPQYLYVMPSKVNIPVYLNFRTNLLNRAWSPYISLSVGARISPFMEQLEINESVEYNQSGVLGDLSFGVEKRCGEKISLYLGLGCRIESFLAITNVAKKDTYFFSPKFKNSFVNGFNLHIGLSF